MKRKKVLVLPEEEKVFKKILEYNTYTGANIVFRVAGGWVRDRLMGIECHDIDIAIDRASGAVFAKGFAKYIKKQGEEQVHGFHIIPYNHEKAKHLETVSLVYKGYTIDFVALRTEKYTNTRIPTIKTGTPKEDAERRDLTINALFYNINTKEIEDYTGQGLYDLEHRIIRTPISPMTTFFDDPLRVLRVLRFSARLSFSIVPEILSTFESPETVQRIGLIVSRERIGQEMKKTLSLPNYHIALVIMIKYNITSVIFPHVEISGECRIQALEYIEQKKCMEKEWLDRHPIFCIQQSSMIYVNLFSILHHAIRSPHIKKQCVPAFTVIEDLRWTKKEKIVVENIARSLLFISNTAKSSADIEKGSQELQMAYRRWLIQIVRLSGEITPLALTIYEIVLKTQKETGCTNASKSFLSPVSVLQVGLDIARYGYKDSWKTQSPVPYSLIVQNTGAAPAEAKKCMEECAVLSILYNTTSRHKLLALLKKTYLAEQQ